MGSRLRRRRRRGRSGHRRQGFAELDGRGPSADPHPPSVLGIPTATEIALLLSPVGEPLLFPPPVFYLTDALRRARGMTKRIEVRRGEKAAILLSTRPAARPAFCTSIQAKGKPSSSMKGFFGKTAQREPEGINRFSRSWKNAESDPRAGTSAISQGCLPSGHASTHSTKGPKISRRVLRNSGEKPRTKAGSSPGRENFAQGVGTRGF